ncbi:hypothetical protein [Chitinophaga filiformis]|uniref:Uncharacterized protein n=1 Tax=Chitinophaga filiformis TaxID=104663 RepID=A0ABY4I8Q7_CHIFI|nr:hypothetical protein [Chitinophaga filiformis]UPK72287.1 hypothetical protein MYF79_13415 [Chitinophaga filiformis]
MVTDFYPFMKVSLHEDCGVVTEEFFEINVDRQQNVDHRIYDVIRWDTENSSDSEDWRGLWDSFSAAGGKEIIQEHQFMFINNDGTVKQ